MSKNKNEEKEPRSFKEVVKEYIPYIIVIILVLLIKKFIVAPIRVNGASMNDTLKNGDIMIMDEISYKFNDIKRYDIVIVDEGQELIIKRVIGLPNETIEYRNNKLYVNGKLQKQKYGKGNTDDFKITLKNEQYFVLGDNRENSLDSRAFGPFDKDRIIGKTSLTVFPISRIGNKK